MMASLGKLETLNFRNARGKSEDVGKSGTHEMTKSEMAPNPRFHSTKVYEIALVNLETYYSFPNIDDTNNVFIYSHDQGTTWTK